MVRWVLQNGPDYLSQNGPTLFQNGPGVTKWSNFVTNCLILLQNGLIVIKWSSPGGQIFNFFEI